MAEIIKILEVIGTIAFSISGAIVAISAGFDVIGVIFVGCITAFGGGVIRDLLLGINPPSIFNNYPMALISIFTVIAVLLIAYMNRKSFNAFRTKIEYINNFFDAVGLSAFTVIGAEIAYINGFAENGFAVIVISIITCVSGGIFRDILTDTAPYIFKKHIYAVATLFGSLLYFLLRSYTENISLTSVLSMFSVFIIRILATKYRWNLPKIHIENNSD